MTIQCGAMPLHPWVGHTSDVLLQDSDHEEDADDWDAIDAFAEVGASDVTSSSHVAMS